MKIIGRIEPKFTNDGEVLNAEYIDGSIVELTSQEAMTLKILQDACNGRQWKIGDMMDSYHYKPQDTNMAEVFALVYTFARTRFAVNDFKAVINDLEEIITRLEKVDEL